MNSKTRVLAAGVVLASFFTSMAFAAGPAATIDQLDWMTGNWAGQLGPNQLEENWIATEGGSIAAMVRMTGGGSTSMFEMITIEEVDGSLVLNIQQWDPGFKPRTTVPQTMELEEITANSVKFRAVTEGGMSSLGYSNPDAETFIIHVGRPDGSVLDLPLKARSLW
ncbi:MAG: DUF6265 family protein [Proteobacteria bacterium]|nr:DUF6265 family protein [Pseudomonadota bacterium]